MEFQHIWDNILKHEGAEFYTKTHLPFTYKIKGGCVVPNRTNYPLAKINFEKAAKMLPLEGPGQINSMVMGPSYVYSLLTDKRIIG
ncbi:MAG TPA: hypothetical protein PK854_03405 [Oscillospiraceae bacterium]|mgnify:CR=1 FL=1|nr:hypothetical protein [Oscillospiraceae bacterium]HPS34292.1 hypothetical protein [Oscillospiraceae bacterium]